jgi:predicted Zn-dependent peptidase
VRWEQQKDIFDKILKNKIIKKTKTKEFQKEPAVKIKHKKSDQTHLIIGFRAFDVYDERNYALNIASTILGKGFSSRLFTKMRDELGMCYYVKTWNDEKTDRGAFGVATGVNNLRVFEAVKVLMEEFRKIRDENLSDIEINKAKEFLAGHIATSLETSDDLAQYFGFQELVHEKILKPDEKIKKLRAVTKDDVRKVLKQIMKPEKLNLALIGPFTERDENKFKKLLKI